MRSITGLRRILRQFGVGVLGIALTTVAMAGKITDDAVRTAQAMAREAYTFGYQNGGCDEARVKGKLSQRQSESLALYANLCQEGAADKQAGKAASPDQAGITVAEELALQAYKDKDAVAARKWFLQAAEGGRVRAQLVLGIMYRDGAGGPQDCNKAIKWLGKAAEAGSADAQYNLGIIYHNGQCVTADYRQAFDLYSKAAEQQHAGSWTNLGVLLINGQGMQPNRVGAYVYWRVGAELGDGYASDLIGKTQFSEAEKQAGEATLQKLFGGGN